MTQPRQHAFHTLLSKAPPRAASFIVTIYGDVVEPRGGVLWMGSLIECCRQHGISESLVRTAVSRLVSAGHLIGERLGRKSYYRLSADGQAEFRSAGHLLFAPPALPDGWLVALAPDMREVNLPAGWVRIGGAAAMAPEGSMREVPGCTVLTAQPGTGLDNLTGFAARHWPLAGVSAAYGDFIGRFKPLDAATAGTALSDAEALALRLRLVDDYRAAALADPRLPRGALPPDWPAARAQGIFRRIYLTLSPAADRHVAKSFADSDGNLPERTGETLKRQAALQDALV